MEPISLLIGLLVVVAIIVVLVWLINQMALPEPLRTVFIAIVAIIFLLVVVRYLGVL